MRKLFRSVMAALRPHTNLVVETDLMRAQSEHLTKIKGEITTSFNELASLTNATISEASELNDKLNTAHQNGIAFISHLGKVIFANKRCFDITGFKTIGQIKSCTLHNDDGSVMDFAKLAISIFETKEQPGFIKGTLLLTGSKKSNISPVKITLADLKPNTLGDIIFVCQVSNTGISIEPDQA